MSYIDELLKEQCPNGVEWKELGEVFDTKNGYTPAKSNKEYWTDGTVPWFRMEDIRENGRILDKSIQYVSQTAVKGGKLFKENSIIVATSATIGEHALITVPFLSNQRFTVLTLKESLEDNVNMKFMYYYCFLLDEWCKNNVSLSSFASVDMTGFRKVKIPLPPLEIQKEIVKILDKFTEYVTELTAELTAELTFRKKQYSYYRDKLLSFDDDVYQVEWKTLKDVAKLKNGKDWKNLPPGNVPVYGSGGAMGEFVDEYVYDKPTVLIPRKGSIANLFYLEKPFWNVDTIYYTEIDDGQIIPRYLYHYLTTVDLENMATNPTRPSLTQSIIDKIKIPVPSLDIQSRIVQVLDNFDTVCHDLNIGLPKEIELRQKQYAYFREKLLTFAAEGVYAKSRVE